MTTKTIGLLVPLAVVALAAAQDPQDARQQPPAQLDVDLAVNADLAMT